MSRTWMGGAAPHSHWEWDRSGNSKRAPLVAVAAGKTLPKSMWAFHASARRGARCPVHWPKPVTWPDRQRMHSLVDKVLKQISVLPVLLTSVSLHPHQRVPLDL